MNLIFRISIDLTRVVYVAAKTPREALVVLDGAENELHDWPADYVSRGIEIVGAANVPSGMLVPSETAT